MVICKFFQEGRCRYGDSCRNEHPRNQSSNQNRFAALSNAPNGPRGRAGTFGGGQEAEKQYNISTEGIRADLTEERPIWPTSCYGPGSGAPRQLLEGPIELSPEEVRLQFYLAQVSNQTQEYAKHEENMLNQVNQQVQQILNDIEGAKRYVLDAENQHPNRLDMMQQVAPSFPWVNRPKLAQLSGFGQAATGFAASSGAPTQGQFGQPSSLNAPKPAFGTPSVAGQGSAFGQPSSLGGAAAFGKPSTLGGTAAFGQASTLGQSSPFGGAQKPAAFGQASQMGAKGGFGASSTPAFGQSGFGTAASKPAFGVSSQPAQPAFGQPSQPSAFGAPLQARQSTFGQASQPGNSNAFGQPSTIGVPSGSKLSPFAAAAQNQQEPKPNPFASAAQDAPKPFSSTTTQPANSNPFAAAAAAAPNHQNSASPFGAHTQPQQPSTNPFASKSGPSATPAAATTGTGGAATASVPPFGTRWQATTFHGKRIVGDANGFACVESPVPGQPNKTGLDRVWFPDGAPPTNVPNPDAVTKDAEASPEVYESQLGEVLKGLYEYVFREGKFKDGIMPELPPKREWIGWDM